MKNKFMIEPKLMAGRVGTVPTTALRLLASLLVFICFALPGYAQNRTIKGVIIDTMDEPIIGASVVIDKTTVGTITDLDGQFTLEVPADTKLLKITYIGYSTQMVDVTNTNNVKIVLQEDAQKLDEVVVVGFGTQKRVNLTGAVAAVTAKELNATKNQNTQNMLTGKIAGVRVVQKTSESGEFNNQFDIRGYGTPLIVIDGVPRGNDSFARLSPDEIESISVLKDASAAVYGVKAANGVVLVTTKRGEVGKTKISYNGYYGFQRPSDVLKPVGSADRMTLFNEKSMRSLDNPSLTYTDEQIGAYLTGEKQSTDWYDATLKNNAGQQQHNVSASGGTQKVDYFLNFGYSQQDGFFRSGDLNYDRFNLRSNINAQLTDRLKVSLNVNGILDTKKSPSTPIWEIYKQLWRLIPDDPIYANNNPLYYQRNASAADVNNTVALTSADVSGYRKNINKIFQATGTFTYDIPYVKGLSAKGMYTFDNTISDNSIYLKEFYEYDYNSVNDTYVGTAKNGPTNLDRKYKTAQTNLWQLSLNYENSFGQHNVSGFVLYEESHSKGDNIKAFRQFSIPLPYLFAGEGNENQIGTADANDIYEYASKSWVGKVNYDFAGKYLVEASFRYDGSSKFPPSKRWGFFPAASIGWRMSEEAFIKDNLSFVQNLKIRASYGKLGDDGAIDYQFIGGYNYPNTDGGRINNYPTGYVFDGTYANGLGFRITPNPNITWYTSKTLNIGLDADMWGGLLGFSFDVFERKRDGLLENRLVSVPGTFGSKMPQENINSDITRGLELELRHRHRIGDFGYNVLANIALTRSKWNHREQSPFGNSWDNYRNNKSNRWKDIWFGWGDNGRYTSYDQIANSPIFTDNGMLPGDYIYEDWNGDGIIDDYDRHPIATATDAEKADFQDKRNYPLLNFGLTLSAQYKGFDLSVLFQGAGMSYVSYGDQLSTPLGWNGNALDLFLDRWRPEDPKKNPYDPTNKWIGGYYSYGATKPDDNSSFAIQNGSYLRMKSIELGYTIPARTLSVLGVKNLRVYVNAYNLFTITDVKGVDPERPTEQFGYMYPLNKTVNFGLSLDF
ncbi:MAG: TonB-dependent receptor [Bacteroides sp.]|nr:TonB-dependent receptor [Bacteroides sp.]